MFDTLHRWQGPDACGGGFQAGDLGWKLRFGRDAVAAAVTEFTNERGETGAILLNDTDDHWWFAIDPALLVDWPLAEAIAAWVDEATGALRVAIDGPHPQAVWRQAIARRGFTATLDEVYVHFWQPLSAADAIEVPGVDWTRTDADIADRVRVQRDSFANSTFTVERWHAMAAGPTFRRELDLLARTETGEAASALTAWFAGEGRCGMIEPLGTHPDFRQQGHGRRVLRAACATLAGMGANGVTVITYFDSPAAVRVYLSAGFRALDTLTAMARPLRS